MAIKTEDIYVAVSKREGSLTHPGLATWMKSGTFTIRWLHMKYL